MVPSTRVPTGGMVVAERYRLLEPLGAGGMGAVWRAEHVSLRSPVAVKLLNPAIADDPEMLDRFLREAQSAAALRGTYVVQVFDYGVHDGMPFIAMELLSGITLGMRLTACHQLRYADLGWIFAHVSRAVSKAHELGIVHRDLKPDNIFIVREGDEEIAKVLDFGIAKVLPSSTPLEDANKTTRTGTVLGTPFYMSPEQARGNRTVDFRADLWSMGVIAFECLTGRLPFASSALGDLVVKICTQTTPRPSDYADVPSGFDEWFARACEKTPDERFQSMREQNEALQLLLGTSVAPVSPNRSTPRAHRITPENSPLNGDLSIDFGDFHTLESIAPPAIDAATLDARLKTASSADGGAPVGKRLSSAAPVEIVAIAGKRRPRWLTALALGIVGLGLALLANREKTQRTTSAEPMPAAKAVVVVPPLLEVDRAVPSATDLASRSLAPSSSTQAPNDTNAIASNTAPMDMTSGPVKLPKKATGATKTAEPASVTPAQTAVGSSPDATTTDPGAKVTQAEPSPKAAAPAAGSASSETFRGRELFDDRE